MIEIRRDHASEARGFLTWYAGLLGVTALAYFADLKAGKAWPEEYILSLTIPFTVMPIFVWYAFVPRRIRYNEEELEFTSRLSGVSTLPFSALRTWGFGRQTIFLRFVGPGTNRRMIQIAPAFYPKDEIECLLSFLRANFPERKGGLRSFV